MKKFFLVGLCLTFMPPSDMMGITPPKNGVVPEHLRVYFERIRKEYNQGYWGELIQQRQQDRTSHRVGEAFAIASDTVNAPLILGKYSNSTNIYPASTFQQELFDGPNPTGTMTQFYTENSYGKLYMTGKALGWFGVSRTFDYYVHDGGSGNAGLNYGGRDFTIDVLVEADKTVDFSKFVKFVDAEGAHVPQLGIIHTGADAASGADNIWSHRWNIRERLLDRKNSGTESIVNINSILSNGHYRTNDSLNGKPVIFDGDYAIQPELSGSVNTNGNPKAIGVFTHEFGHIFGLPDLYDTDNTSEGLGGWCLMASGSYGGDQRHEATPTHMSAWCKEQLGWVSPVVVNSYLPQQPIRQVEKYPEVYKLYVRGIPGGQYFLIENRQQVGFDKYLLNSGLLIFHVDPSVTTGNTNENHPLVDLEQADGLRNLNTKTNRGDAGDPFPGLANNRNFDGYSTPDSKDYSLAQTYVGVRKISNSDTVMSADFDIGTRAFINISSLSLSEAGVNNNNSRVDPSESGTLTVGLSNVYPVNLFNGKVTVTSTSADIVIDTTSQFVSLNGLSSTQYVMNSVITVKASAPQRTISLTVNVQSPEATFNRSFEAVIGFPGILLLAMDSAAVENNTSYYQTAVLKYGGFFEQARFGTQSIQALRFDKRQIIMYFTGRKKDQTLPDSLGDSLKTFSEKGGKLFISGQNIAEDLNLRGSSLQGQLLHATWSKNIVFGKTLFGIPSDKFGGEIPKLFIAGSNGASNQGSPDEIIVDTLVAHPSFIWNSQTGTSYGGLWWENPAKGSKLVFWSFGFEAINDSSAGANTQSQAMTSVLNWFYGITSTPELSNGFIAPASFTLNQNYPNPFNPTTHFRFTVPEAHQPSAEIADVRFVFLKIYDALGREIATLVSQPMNAGTYTVRWDATNFPSGVYFYRLTAEGFSETKKLSLIK